VRPALSLRVARQAAEFAFRPKQSVLSFSQIISFLSGNIFAPAWKAGYNFGKKPAAKSRPPG
jgi:hypothetical protein